MQNVKLVLIAALLPLLAGCTLSFGTPQQPPHLGVYKSSDFGVTWMEKNTFLSSGGIGTIAGISIKDIIVDPQDPQALYLTTHEDGLLYSYDGGESWQLARQLSGLIASLSIDPTNKCVLYATQVNRLVKTVDCGREWRDVYQDNRQNVSTTASAIDQAHPLSLYIGNSIGDILKSVDGGASWQVIQRFSDPIATIMIDPSDSRVVYVATKTKGLFKSTDAGNSWANLNEGLKQYNGALNFHQLGFDPNNPDTLLLVAGYGLIVTTDGGTTWQPISLITPANSADIIAAAISPASSIEVYYVTASTFYRTVDGGQNWITRKLPQPSLPSTLFIDRHNPAVLFMTLAKSR